MLLGVTYTWAGGTGNWNNGGRWSEPGLPGAINPVVVTGSIDSGPTVSSPFTVASIETEIGAGIGFATSAGSSVVLGDVDNAGIITLGLLSGTAGDSSLTIDGTLTNSDELICAGNSGSHATVSASEVNNSGGTLRLSGYASSALAELEVTGGGASLGAAKGSLSGVVSLIGHALIQFAGGQITTIAAKSSLELVGDNAYVADVGSTTSNSALTGLTNVKGKLFLSGYLTGVSHINGPTIATSNGLDNTGYVELDGVGQGTGSGGCNLDIGGAITNTGQIGINRNGAKLQARDTMSASSFDNAGGALKIQGGERLAELVLASAASLSATAGVLSGSVYLNKHSLIQFASGQITTIATMSSLTLGGKYGFIADAGSTQSNSALDGLTENDGALDLLYGAAVTTSADLDNVGAIQLTGGGALNVTGDLTNSGDVLISPGAASLAKTTTLSADNIDNAGGTIELNALASGGSNATLAISGTLTNNGAVNLYADTAEIAGSVSGTTGTFGLNSGSTLQFDSSVASGETVTDNGANEIALNMATLFGGTIAGFGAGDTIDALSFASGSTSFNYVENGGHTGGTLTLTDGPQVAHILMSGIYSNADFFLGPDKGTGTLVGFL